MKTCKEEYLKLFFKTRPYDELTVGQVLIILEVAFSERRLNTPYDQAHPRGIEPQKFIENVLRRAYYILSQEITPHYLTEIRFLELKNS